VFNSDGFILNEDISDSSGKATLYTPYYPHNPYVLQAFYKGLSVFEGDFSGLRRTVSLPIDIELFDFLVQVRDNLQFPPGIDLTLTLIHANENEFKLIGEDLGSGVFSFINVPAGEYTLHTSYADFMDEKFLRLPRDDDVIYMDFSALFEVTINVFDSLGNPLFDHNISFEICRNNQHVETSKDQKFVLPPGTYTIKAYNKNEVIGTKVVDLTSSRTVKLVTLLSSLIPLFVIISCLLSIGGLVVITLMRRISIHSLFLGFAIFLAIISLVQPWWSLNGSTASQEIQRETQIFISPAVMIEKTVHHSQSMLDIAEIPEVYNDLLKNIMILALTACLFFGVSILLKRFRKLIFSYIGSFLGLVLLLVVISLFFIGTSKLCEASIGEVQGEGSLIVEFEESEQLDAQWGFSTGFYLILLSNTCVLLCFFVEVKQKLFRQKKS
jgi:hypothetical protein